MSETSSEVRKIYVRDLAGHDTVQTVFKVERKERMASRSGRGYLVLGLCDKTGHLDARVFENIDAAFGAFEVGDYLLVSGKVGQFQGKTQLVVELLEKIDAGPIDAAEFAAPPEAPKAAPEERHQAPKAHTEARTRLIRVLEDPKVKSGFEALLRHLENYIDERIAEKTGTPLPPKKNKEREHRAPRVEHKKKDGAHASSPSAPPARDPALPKDLAFKPFAALVPEEPKAS